MNNWISTEDRLPDKFDKYIICTLFGVIDICNYGYAEPKVDHVPCFYFWENDWSRCWRPDVIAWMPLPEPPEWRKR